jgi:hypothetical protein
MTITDKYASPPTEVTPPPAKRSHEAAKIIVAAVTVVVAATGLTAYFVHRHHQQAASSQVSFSDAADKAAKSLGIQEHPVTSAPTGTPASFFLEEVARWNNGHPQSRLDSLSTTEVLDAGTTLCADREPGLGDNVSAVADAVAARDLSVGPSRDDYDALASIAFTTLCR